jgi:hypothetical protein
MGGKPPYENTPYGKPPYGNPPYAKPQQGMPPPNFDANVKRKDTCYYCGKFGHLAREFYKRKYHESKHRNKRQTDHFVEGGETMNDEFKNIRLFISVVSLSIEKDDSNAWYVDFGASIHMSFNKYWFENYHETNNLVLIYILGMITHIKLKDMVIYM